MPLIEKRGDRTVKVLRWIARIITILVIVYSLTMLIGYSISDPHSEGDEFPWFIFVLFPTFIAMILSWRWEKIGGILVILGGICMAITVFITAGHNKFFAASFISSPFIYSGILFLGCWYRSEKILIKDK
jgi:peptidoglycan/LPS O-acetylase OafA/YrhL